MQVRVKKGEKSPVHFSARARSENIWEKLSCRYQGQCRRRWRCIRYWSRVSPAPTVKTTVRQLCSCSPFRSMINQTISDALRLQRRKMEDHKCYFPNTWQISPPVMFSELTVLSNSEVTNGIETSSYLGVLSSSIQFLGNSLLNTQYILLQGFTSACHCWYNPSLHAAEVLTTSWAPRCRQKHEVLKRKTFIHWVNCSILRFLFKIRIYEQIYEHTISIRIATSLGP